MRKPPGHNMKTLRVIRKERDRLTIMTGVREEELTLVQAAQLMGVCYRPSMGIWRRCHADGDVGVMHRLRGRSCARRKPPEWRAEALAVPASEGALPGAG